MSDAAEHAGPPRDTRAGTRGFAAHRHAEQRAVALGATVIAEAAPELGAAYAEWTARFG